MVTNIQILLRDITRCSNVIVSVDQENHPCAQVVRKMRFIAPLVPEPWSGNLRDAPILFLSSNPSLNRKESYPEESWSDSQMEDFFQYRFGGGHRQWIKEGLYPLHQDKSYSDKWVRYWAYVIKRSAELLGKEKDQIVPGEDFSLSEVVHCKCKKEAAAKGALDECAGRFLRRVIHASGARVIVCVGNLARKGLENVFDEIEGKRFRNVFGPVLVGGQSRYFVFVPHSNARGKPKCYEKVLSRRDLHRLQNFLRLSSSNHKS